MSGKTGRDGLTGGNVGDGGSGAGVEGSFSLFQVVDLRSSSSEITTEFRGVDVWGPVEVYSKWTSWLPSSMSSSKSTFRRSSSSIASQKALWSSIPASLIAAFTSWTVVKRASSSAAAACDSASWTWDHEPAGTILSCRASVSRETQTSSANWKKHRWHPNRLATSKSHFIEVFPTTDLYTVSVVAGSVGFGFKVARPWRDLAENWAVLEGWWGGVVERVVSKSVSMFESMSEPEPESVSEDEAVSKSWVGWGVSILHFLALLTLADDSCFSE